MPRNRGSKISKIFLSAQQGNFKQCHTNVPLKSPLRGPSRLWMLSQSNAWWLCVAPATRVNCLPVAGCGGLTPMANFCQRKWTGFEPKSIDFAPLLHTSPATRMNAWQTKLCHHGPLPAGDETGPSHGHPAGHCQARNARGGVCQAETPNPGFTPHPAAACLGQPTSEAAQRNPEHCSSPAEADVSGNQQHAEPAAMT